MSVHKSLKAAGGLMRTRNVFTRAERVAILKREGRLQDDDDVVHLPKTKVPKLRRAKPKKKKEEAATDEAATPTEE